MSLLKKGFYLFLPIILGSIVGFIISGSIDYTSLIKPPLAPPSWLFPVAWSNIYLLMGISYYLLKKEYEELEHKKFCVDDKQGICGMIEKAIQSIELSIDEEGGVVKSEAAIDMMIESGIPSLEKIEKRKFYVDDAFVLFIREKGKELPLPYGPRNLD